MYTDFHERFEDWMPTTNEAPRATVDEVPEFLLLAPANGDDALDRIAILGEN